MEKPATPIQAVVFDCFGVLYDDAFRMFIEQYVPDATMRQYYYDLARAMDRGHVSEKIFYAQLSQLSGEEPQRIKRLMQEVNLINQNVVKIIQELKPQYAIGMLSNAERSMLDRFLANEDLASHFDQILASSETSYVKPEREIFEEMAKRMDATFAEMAFIDDSIRNVSAAKDYGIAAIHYQNPLDLRQQLAKIL